jgi:hypothetical protein
MACRCICPQSVDGQRSFLIPIGASFAAADSSRKRMEAGGKRLTAPLVAPSWLLLPVTLKATLLGVLDLTSRVPAERW